MKKKQSNNFELKIFGRELGDPYAAGSHKGKQSPSSLAGGSIMAEEGNQSFIFQSLLCKTSM